MRDRDEILRKALIQIEDALAEMRSALYPIHDPASKKHDERSRNTAESPVSQRSVTHAISSVRNLAVHQITSEHPLSGPEQSVLSSVAWLGGAKPLQMHRTLIAALAGYAPTDKSFHETLEKLCRQRLIEMTATAVRLTEFGSQIAPTGSAPLTTQTLVDRIAVQLTRDQNTVFRFLVEKRGIGIRRDKIAQNCGIRADSSSFRKDLAILRKLMLITRVASDTYASSDIVFLD